MFIQSYLPLFSIIQSRLRSVSDAKNMPPTFPLQSLAPVVSIASNVLL